MPINETAKEEASSDSIKTDVESKSGQVTREGSRKELHKKLIHTGTLEDSNSQSSMEGKEEKLTSDDEKEDDDQVSDLMSTGSIE